MKTKLTTEERIVRQLRNGFFGHREMVETLGITFKEYWRAVGALGSVLLVCKRSISLA